MESFFPKAIVAEVLATLSIWEMPDKLKETLNVSIFIGKLQF